MVTSRARASPAARRFCPSELERPAAEPTGGLGDLASGLAALTDQIALEFRQGSEDVQLQLPAPRCRVDRLLQ